MNWSSLLSTERIGTANTAQDSKSAIRSAFERDYDRIIFSQPFRSLQDKTQVHPIPEHDFVHTRLTHSLEVSSVGKSLGKKIGATVLQRHKMLSAFVASDFGAIVAAASLAHDLGNPPFGHSGERAISEFFINHTQGKHFKEFLSSTQWKDITCFEGNAQGFRILNKEQYQGLRLTYSTLGAFTKYPCTSVMQQADGNKTSRKKYGFFQTEKMLFNKIAKKLGLTKVAENLWARHPLTFLVEAADDICYSIIDLEDGCRLGLVSFKEAVNLFAGILKDRFKPEKLRLIPGKTEQIGMLRALVIDQLINECTMVFLDHEEAILNNKFDQPLTSHVDSNTVLKEISRVSYNKIYRARHVVEREVAGYTALSGLLEEFTLVGKCYLEKNLSGKQEALIHLLPPEMKSEMDMLVEKKKLPNVDSAALLYDMLRVCIDFIAGMTDRYALSLYSKTRAYSMNPTYMG